MTMAAEVAAYYDKSTKRWEKQCGGNRHHGYYGPDDPFGELMYWRGIELCSVQIKRNQSTGNEPLRKPKNIVDVGCGIGGTGRYFVKKFGANYCGISLSPVEVRRAQELAVVEGLQDKMSFIVGDAVDQPFSDGQFDLVWAFDIIANSPHKLKFFSELARIAAPGASIIISTCCQRELSPGEEGLKPDEKNLLNKICKPYHQSLSCTASDHVKIAQSLGLQNFEMANWSEHVTPFWEAINRSNRTLWGLTSLLLSGWGGIKRALAVPTLLEAYSKKLISYNVIVCRKPS